ncbi:hypothetical protein [Photobacterium arenosum]|uniref:hypothetical protein n=1 Tax=Photobacterium arenosum TaxID=2774143 RepID=UPI0035CED2A5
MSAQYEDPAAIGAMGKLRQFQEGRNHCDQYHHLDIKGIEAHQIYPCDGEETDINGIRIGRGITSSLEMYGISGRFRISSNQVTEVTLR